MQNNKFPKNFILGTATSAFQIEGEGDTEWKGFIGKDGTSLGNAIDHYNRIDEDLEYIVELGAYRFSMDWSKLQKGPYFDLDREVAKHYEKIFKKLKENNRKIMLVLNHFANPSWFMEKGGWINPESTDFYTAYAGKVVDMFEEYIDFINTFNEPGVYANMAYLLKNFPPKEFNIVKRSKVLKNMSEAHKFSYDYIKGINPDIEIGVSKAWTPIDNFLKCSIFRNIINNFQLESVDKLFAGSGYVDFIGFSYYGKISAAVLSKEGRKRLDKKGIEHDDMWELYPEGIYNTIKYFGAKYKKPIIITENGTCTKDDELRINNLYNHLKFVKKAIDEGNNVIGYFHWSTFDNFELNYGPSRRFGLVSVDFDSPKLERKIKKSGEYYHNLVKTKELKAR